MFEAIAFFTSADDIAVPDDNTRQTVNQLAPWSVPRNIRICVGR